MDVIKTADYIIDLGPEGGDEGGLVIAEGTPEEVALSGTYTGEFLSKILNEKPLISSIESGDDVISEGSSGNK